MLSELIQSSSYRHQNPFEITKNSQLNHKYKNQRVLVIDDDSNVLNLVRSILVDFSNLEVFTANDPFEAMDILNHQVVDLIILDWSLPMMSGPETLQRAEHILKTDPNVPLEWEKKKANVILFTVQEKKECKSVNSEHFKYAGYIPKNGSNYETISNSILGFLNHR